MRLPNPVGWLINPDIVVKSASDPFTFVKSLECGLV